MSSGAGDEAINEVAGQRVAGDGLGAIVEERHQQAEDERRQREGDGPE
ncbi:MAG TPA: hypothetical protein PLR07_08435 [Promineifilum sp.]|nr:hypothetical protein [Promineifilum sp.]